MCSCLCSVIVLCGMMMKGREKVPTHSLLFSKSTKETARINVPIRRTNRYQLCVICLLNIHTAEGFGI